MGTEGIQRLKRPPPGKSGGWRTLVIGYGNELRGDDGIGINVAGRIAARRLEGVRVIRRRQLMPELAEDIAQAGRVIFIDASVVPHPRGVEVRQISPPAGDTQGFAHALGPEQLLGLCEQIYRRRTPAWLVAVPAFDLELQAGLSGGARGLLAEATGEVERLCTNSR
jgi:hydrogenase maturation protease